MHESVIGAPNLAEWPGLMVRGDEGRDHTEGAHGQIGHRQPYQAKWCKME